tara:strand:- start:2792 stop:4864 length:2073 start_codon:yes stop_codon:yes gene_type:complete
MIDLSKLFSPSTQDTQRTAIQQQLAEADSKSMAQETAEVSQGFDEHLGFLEGVGNIFKTIGGGIKNFFVQLFGINQANKELELPQEEDAFLFNNMIKRQEEIQTLKSNDPFGYTAKGVVKHLNKKLEDTLPTAPSEASKIELQKLNTELQTQAAVNAMDHESLIRKEQRASKVTEAVDSLRKQAFTDPDSLPTYLDQVGGAKSILTKDGLFDPDAVEGVINGMAGHVYEGALEGKIQSGRQDEVFSDLTSPAADQYVNNDQFMKLYSSLMTIEFDNAKKLIKDTDLAKDSMRMILGVGPAKASDDKKASDAMFELHAQNIMDLKGMPINMSTEELANQTLSIYKTFPGMSVGTVHSNMLYNAVVNGTPDVAVNSARIVSAMLKDPDVSGRAIKLNKTARKEALKIAKLSEYGFSNDEAVKLARTELRSTDPNKITLAKNQLKQSLEDGDLEDMISDALGGGFWGTDADLSEVKLEAQSILTPLVMQTGDVELAMDQLGGKLAKKYRVSKFNGDEEVMKYAPEMYYSGKELKVMKTEFTNYLDNISTSLGGTPSGDGRTINTPNGDVEVKIEAAGPITANGSKESRKYVIKNKKTGRLIKQDDLIPDGQPVPIVFDFNLTQTEYYQGQVAKYNKKQEEIKAQREAFVQRQERIQAWKDEIKQRRNLSDEQIEEMNMFDIEKILLELRKEGN